MNITDDQQTIVLSIITSVIISILSQLIGHWLRSSSENRKKKQIKKKLISDIQRFMDGLAEKNNKQAFIALEIIGSRLFERLYWEYSIGSDGYTISDSKYSLDISKHGVSGQADYQYWVYLDDITNKGAKPTEQEFDVHFRADLLKNKVIKPWHLTKYKK